MFKSRRTILWVTTALFASSLPAGAPAARDTQTILAPGLYVFQTRLDHATCVDSSTSGRVTSYFAAIDGRPGAVEMKMRLQNSAHWPDWKITVRENEKVYGDSQQAKVEGPHRGEAHFELELTRGKLVGRGSRAWTMRVDGKPTRCRMAFDALLKPLHD